MICKFCNATLNDDAKFCRKCGKEIVSEEPATEEVKPAEEAKPAADVDLNAVGTQPVAPMPPSTSGSDAATPPQTKKKSKINLIELVSGALFLVIGLLKALSSGTSIYSTSFGADFYTYSYKGIVECAELLADLNSSVSLLIAAIGALMIFHSLKGGQK